MTVTSVQQFLSSYQRVIPKAKIQGGNRGTKKEHQKPFLKKGSGKSSTLKRHHAELVHEEECLSTPIREVSESADATPSPAMMNENDQVSPTATNILKEMSLNAKVLTQFDELPVAPSPLQKRVNVTATNRMSTPFRRRSHSQVGEASRDLNVFDSRTIGNKNPVTLSKPVKQRNTRTKQTASRIQSYLRLLRKHKKDILNNLIPVVLLIVCVLICYYLITIVLEVSLRNRSRSARKMIM